MTNSLIQFIVDMINLALLYLSFLCVHVNPWGFRGHIAISRIAFSQLNQKTVDYLSKTMGKTVDADGFAEMSIWADLVARSEDFGWTRSLHFTQKGNCLTNSLEQVDPDCLLSATNYFTDILMDNAGDPTPRVSKSEALRFLIHFIGDLHAPFHIGDLEDRNGALIFVKDPLACLGMKIGDPLPMTSLHTIWDNHVLSLYEKRAGSRLRDVVDDIIKITNARKTTTISGRSSGFFKHDSISEIALKAALKSRDITTGVGMVTPGGRRIESRTNLSKAYYDKACPVAINALREAGISLAEILNRIADQQDSSSDPLIVV